MHDARLHCDSTMFFTAHSAGMFIKGLEQPQHAFFTQKAASLYIDADIYPDLYPQDKY